MFSNIRSILAISLLCACSSAGESHHPVKANPCATPGATYLARYTAESGNCGAIPSEVINVTKEGDVPQAETQTITCASSEQEGCRINNSGCVSHSPQCTINTTTTITFAQDGASAEGLYSVRVTDCSNGSSCSGTYRVYLDRQ